MNTAMNGLGRADASIHELMTRLRTLLDVLNEEGVEATTVLRERIAASIDTLEPRLERMRESVADTAGSIQEVIEDHPWGAVAVGALAGIAVGCVAVVVASNFVPESGLADKASGYADKAAGYGRDVARRYRPYARRARKLASNYWPF